MFYFRAIVNFWFESWFQVFAPQAYKSWVENWWPIHQHWFQISVLFTQMDAHSCQRHFTVLFWVSSVCFCANFWARMEMHPSHRAELQPWWQWVIPQAHSHPTHCSQKCSSMTHNTCGLLFSAPASPFLFPAANICSGGKGELSRKQVSASANWPHILGDALQDNTLEVIVQVIEVMFLPSRLVFMQLL